MTIELDTTRIGSATAVDVPQGTVSIGRPGFRVAVAGDAVAQTFPIVVRRETLREAQRARSLLRSGTHDQARFTVALEIEVAIAPSAASARAAVAEAAPGEPETIRYVGTTHGLITLLRDVYAAEVADAVILVPLDGSATERHIREQVLPHFADVRHRVA
ncbi:hypothetical protein [Gordonia paraffinivorans]|uniref:hypothetical protein n=1 Tax=Gordonia paraffinivorans TaxID=175628 RepID=UPI001B356F64|nr:hypothetical protein [Gordonia paraffinivorans]MCD2147078.1 hypothetical protein [Gordonia paraffinivorans]